jgi:tetratricopeptide (TPR) repeat protein
MNEVQIDIQNSDILKLSTSNPQRAFQEAKHILDFSEKLSYHKGKAEALRNLAFCSQSLGFIQEGLDFANEALKLFDEQDDKKNLAHVYNTLGFIYDHLNEQNNRLNANLKSKEYSFDSNDIDGMIRSLNNTGDNYIQLGNYTDALVSFKECIDLIQPTNHFMFAVVYCNIGEVYFLKKDYTEAIAYFFLSLDNARKIKSNAVESTAILLLSKVYSAQENYEKAIETLKSGVQLCEDEKKEREELVYLTNLDEADSIIKSSTNIEVEIYQLYAEICEKNGDLQTALWATKKSKSLEKILIDAKHAKEFQTVKLRYEITQLEKLVAERTQELYEINQKLEQEVNLQTKKITELTHKYLEHEKLSLLAELASSISHELNTPFGIISNGAKEVNNGISELIKCIIEGGFNNVYLNFALNFASKKINVPLTSGRNKRKDILEIKEYLISKTIDSEKSSELAQSFVNAKFSIDDIEEIDYVLLTEKRSEILDIIYFLEKTMMLSNTIIDTSISASLIVQELTKIAIGSKTFEITKINLIDNINSVLSVYKYMFERISIELNVDNNIEISGSEINLFQFWKNALLLASNLFEGINGEKYIRISSELRKSTVFIEINFNGKKISDETISNILDVTPIIDSTNKTIISKLSMIKKIITEHRGVFSIVSDESTFLYIELPYNFENL